MRQRLDAAVGRAAVDDDELVAVGELGEQVVDQPAQRRALVEHGDDDADRRAAGGVGARTAGGAGQVLAVGRAGEDRGAEGARGGGGSPCHHTGTPSAERAVAPAAVADRGDVDVVQAAADDPAGERGDGGDVQRALGLLGRVGHRRHDVLPGLQRGAQVGHLEGPARGPGGRRARRGSGSVSRRARPVARPRTSPGATTVPVSPTAVRTPWTSKATTGRPIAIASSGTSGPPSQRDGSATTSAAA